MWFVNDVSVGLFLGPFGRILPRQPAELFHVAVSKNSGKNCNAIDSRSIFCLMIRGLLDAQNSAKCGNGFYIGL
jgi:hypothetical protein